MNLEDRNALEKLVTYRDEEGRTWYERLERWTDYTNFFDVIGKNRSETVYSNVLAWLLNPKESHGLSDFFLRNLINHVLTKNREQFSDALAWSFIDYETVRIVRERTISSGETKGRVDIVIFCNRKKLPYEDNQKPEEEQCNRKFLIAIENKVDSAEHPAGKSGKEQTEEYFKEMSSLCPHPNNRMLLFLSPEGAEPKDENWIALTYEPILQIIKQGKKLLQKEKRDNLLLTEYEKLIERELMSDELKKVCNELYQQYKKAFDLIFENKTDYASIAADIIREVLNSLAKEGNDIRYDATKDSGNTVIRFSSLQFDKALPRVKNTASLGSNGEKYYFTITPYNLKFVDFSDDNRKTDIPLQLCIVRIDDPDSMEGKTILNFGAKPRNKSSYVTVKTEKIRCFGNVNLIDEFEGERERVKNELKDQIIKFVGECEKKLPPSETDEQPAD